MINSWRSFLLRPLGGLLLVLAGAWPLGAKVDLMPAADARQVAEQLPGAEMLEGGIRLRVDQVGTGPLIQRGDRVTALYVGRFLDGKVFNQKRSRSHTFRFQVGAEPREIILGWEWAIRRMQQGGRYTIALPSRLAYGSEGRPGQVPPDMTLIFEIEILAVVRGGSSSK